QIADNRVAEALHDREEVHLIPPMLVFPPLMPPIPVRRSGRSDRGRSGGRTRQSPAPPRPSRAPPAGRASLPAPAIVPPPARCPDTLWFRKERRPPRSRSRR